MELRQVNVYMFYVSYIIISGLSFASMNISLNTLFSKVIGPRRQGTQQGLLQVSGGVARMFGPVIVSFLYVLHGPRAVWLFILFVLALNTILWILFYQRMVPLRMPDNYSAFEKSSLGNESKQTC